MAVAAFAQAPALHGRVWRDELSGVSFPGVASVSGTPVMKQRSLVLVAARRNRSAIAKNKSKRVYKRKERYISKVEEEDEDVNEEAEEDALEALFTQLEKDLEAARAGNKLDDFEKELDEALLDDGKKTKGKKNETASVNALQKFMQEAEKIEAERISKRIVRLEKWQLRKLKAALDLRKSQIPVKALAGETGLDRRDVLTFLRNPPAELIQVVESVSDSEDDSEDEENEEAVEVEKTDSTPSPDANESEAAVQRIGIEEDDGAGPQSWYQRKRIRREHLDTFEKVFQRTKRPTGALIQDMVQLTHVPRKRILDWFENRRREHNARKSVLSNKN